MIDYKERQHAARRTADNSHARTDDDRNLLPDQIILADVQGPGEK
jgi:hypothetical protein